MRNLLAKVPEHRKAEIKAHLVGVRDAPTPEAGRAAAADFLQRYRREFPSACACLSEDLEAPLAHHRLPRRHRKFVRTTNLIERSFRRGATPDQMLPRLFTEKNCLNLVHAILIRAAVRWQGIKIMGLELEQIRLLYEELGIVPAHRLEAVAQTHDPEGAHVNSCSRFRT